MKKITKTSAVALTFVLGVSGNLLVLNTTQAHATSYGGYTQLI